MPNQQSASRTTLTDYKRLFQSLGEAYIIFAADDPVFTIIEQNEAHEHLSTTKRENNIGKSMFDAFPSTAQQYAKEGLSHVLASFRKVIRTGESNILDELEYDRKDVEGRLIQKYWRLSHYPVKDSKGKVIAVCQTSMDITESVQTRRELERAKSQLDQTLSSSSIGTWMWDIATNIVYMDDNFAFLFGGVKPKNTGGGLPPDAMVSAVHPDDKERVLRESYAALDSDEPYESEYRTIDANGEVHWVLARGIVERDEKGKAMSFPGVVIDITERKSAETNLNFLTQASAQFSASMDFRKTLHNIASTVVPHLADWCAIDMLTEQGTIDQVVVIHKDPKKVAWAKELRAKQGPPDINEPTGVANVIRTGESVIYPVITDEMLRAGAKTKQQLELMRSLGFSSVIITPLIIDGKPIGAMTLVAAESRLHYKSIDLEVATGLANRAALAVYNANLYKAAQDEIAERERLQEQLKTANEILESRVRERTEQLQQTNQGLRKEIIKRQGIERALQDNSKDLARSNQELQDFAYVASHDLQEPLRKIQAFGNLLEKEYAGQLGDGADYIARMRKAASRMGVLIEDLLAFSRVTTKANPSVKVDLNEVVGDVISDLETRIVETGGKITVDKLPAVRADPTHMRQLFQNLISNALKFHEQGKAPIVKVSYTDHDSYFEFRVADNGIGFDSKYIDRIFAVFQRLHDRDAYEGTGIGLAVCRKIVERYGGTITAKSEKHKGATFIVRLPKKGTLTS